MRDRKIVSDHAGTRQEHDVSVGTPLAHEGSRPVHGDEKRRADTRSWLDSEPVQAYFAELRKADRPVIYFLSASGKHAPIKIGTTKASRLRRRRSQIQTGTHERLDFLFVIDGDETDEKQIHDTFHLARTRGEWFARTHDLMQFIEELRGMFPDWRDTYEL